MFFWSNWFPAEVLIWDSFWSVQWVVVALKCTLGAGFFFYFYSEVIFIFFYQNGVGFKKKITYLISRDNLVHFGF